LICKISGAPIEAHASIITYHTLIPDMRQILFV